MPHLRLIVAAVLVPFAVWLFLPVPSSGQSLQEKISKKERQIAAKKRKERVLTSTIETYSRRINLLQGDISTLQARQVRRSRPTSPPSAPSWTGSRTTCARSAHGSRGCAPAWPSHGPRSARGSCTCTRPTSPTS